MHWVDRGPEPAGLEAIRISRTSAWVAHYKDGVGRRPNDSDWRRFHDDLSEQSHGLCAYCEEVTQGEVDHFRPISKFPHLVYEWFNWVFACPYCNRSKSNRWPPVGYVDPCTEYAQERPEGYFSFDVEAGVLTPKADSSASRRRRAAQTITDLKLNAFPHLKNRRFALNVIDFALSRIDDDSDKSWVFLESLIDRAHPHSSFARAVLEERGFEIDD